VNSRHGIMGALEEKRHGDKKGGKGRYHVGGYEGGSFVSVVFVGEDSLDAIIVELRDRVEGGALVPPSVP